MGTYNFRNYSKALCWIRRDIRATDHHALCKATYYAKKTALVFVFDRNILDPLEDRDDRRITYIHRSLSELDCKLRERGSMLIVRHGDPVIELPKLAKELKVEAVFTNHDYEPYPIKRDTEVEQRLTEQGQDFHTFKDQVIFEKDEIVSLMSEPYKVYTPYRNAWLSTLGPLNVQEHSINLDALWPMEELINLSHPWTMRDIGFEYNDLWLEPGEDAGYKRLQEFVNLLPNYDKDRDYPAKHGTSGLSVHFRFGTVSIREAVRACLKCSSSGATKWLGELIWREFYQMILFKFPYVVSRAFKPEYNQIRWPGHKKHFELWCEGKTGYPVVDAAMRCFNCTGWMHNRLRMVVASFFVKDLLLDWRLGEAYFARKLLDFELASNNGNWQWAASVGVDAQPYYRVFNPILQSKKFDPQGTFIREWCPELGGFSNESIHWPLKASLAECQQANCFIGRDYPLPIVNHGEQRVLALRLLGAA